MGPDLSLLPLSIYSRVFLRKFDKSIGVFFFHLLNSGDDWFGDSFGLLSSGYGPLGIMVGDEFPISKELDRKDLRCLTRRDSPKTLPGSGDYFVWNRLHFLYLHGCQLRPVW